MKPMLSVITAPLRATNKGARRTSACTKCRGRCCRELPGAAHPEDFRLPVDEKVVDAILSGFWVLEFQVIPRKGRCAFVPRPAYFRKGKLVKGIQLFDPKLTEPRGRCVFLESSGCMLPFKYRPRVCRMLRPAPEHARCTPTRPKSDFLVWENRTPWIANELAAAGERAVSPFERWWELAVTVSDGRRRRRRRRRKV